MALISPTVERNFFRTLNRVVEPAVRRGLFSSRLAPSALIVLESIGYLSGEPRRTPLVSNRLGPYRLVSTVRGERSFWVRNLKKDPRVSYFVGGREREAQALVIAPEFTSEAVADLPAYLQPLVRLMELFASRGWAFALLTRA